MSTSGVRYFAVSVVEANGKRRSLGRFATFSGGEPTVTIGAAWNGGALTPDRTQSRKTYGNIVVSRPFNPARDRAWIRDLNSAIGGARLYTVSKTDLDANDNALHLPDTWTECVLVRVGEPTYSEDDSSPAMWEVEFAPRSRR